MPRLDDRLGRLRSHGIHIQIVEYIRIVKAWCVGERQVHEHKPASSGTKKSSDDATTRAPNSA